MQVEVLDWGLIDYQKALERQRELFEELIKEREGKERDERGERGERGDAGWIVFCEHPHVYTVGKSGKIENLLMSEEWLRGQGVTVHRVERGGDITYHGPGQLVVYPILDLEKLGLGLREYIELLEQCVIDILDRWGIVGERIKGKTGVWVRVGDQKEAKKICAIGVRASRGVVMHGLALNVKTDLRWFEYINPCGMADAKATSIRAILSGEE